MRGSAKEECEGVRGSLILDEALLREYVLQSNDMFRSTTCFSNICICFRCFVVRINNVAMLLAPKAEFNAWKLGDGKGAEQKYFAQFLHFPIRVTDQEMSSLVPSYCRA